MVENDIRSVRFINCRDKIVADYKTNPVGDLISIKVRLGVYSTSFFQYCG